MIKPIWERCTDYFVYVQGPDDASPRPATAEEVERFFLSIPALVTSVAWKPQPEAGA